MMTELDKKLQEMAVTNWTQFAALLGEEAIIAAKTCLLRHHTKASYGAIAIKLGISEKQARTRCDKCEK